MQGVRVRGSGGWKVEVDEHQSPPVSVGITQEGRASDWLSLVGGDQGTVMDSPMRRCPMQNRESLSKEGGTHPSQPGNGQHESSTSGGVWTPRHPKNACKQGDRCRGATLDFRGAVTCIIFSHSSQRCSGMSILLARRLRHRKMATSRCERAGPLRPGWGLTLKPRLTATFLLGSSRANPRAMDGWRDGRERALG